MIKIAPSILAADFFKLGEQLKIVADQGINWLHIDIMDGHFVPNLTFGPSLVKAVKKNTNFFLDVHLMVEEPDFIIPAFRDAGADLITVQVEAIKHLHRTIELIKSLGAKAGVALNPATPVSVLEMIISELDLILVMSVNPGYGGQRFIPFSIEKIKQVSNILTRKKLNIYLEVDGGIEKQTGRWVVQAGANVLVAGTSIFRQKNIAQAIADIRNNVNDISENQKYT